MAHGEGATTRTFQAGRASFRVRCDTVDVRNRLEAVFADLPVGDEATPVKDYTLRSDADGLFSLGEGASALGSPEPFDSALAFLLSNVSRLALDADPQHLHLHCASLESADGGVLVAAPSGTGKSVLAATLLTRGWAYLSDEAVALRKDDRKVTGFAKPLLIKPGGAELVPGLARHLRAEEEADGWITVAAGSIGATTVSVTPAAVVLLASADSPDPTAPPRLEAMHPADATVALMANTMDAERFGPEAVGVLAELASTCHCLSMTIGPPGQMAGGLEEIVREPRPACQIRAFHSSAVPSASAWQVPSAVRAVLVGERAVVHNTEGGSIAALDEAGAAVWRALHGDDPDWWDPEQMSTPGVEAFLHALAQQGLLISASDAAQGRR